MNNIPLSILVAMSETGAFDRPADVAPVVAVTHRKEIVKREIRTAKKPGRGIPAKGYDPIAKKWVK